MLTEQSVSCPSPSRSRANDRLVESFLAIWQDGHYTHLQEWQNRGFVNVIASDISGGRVAVAHARLAAGATPADEALAPVAAAVLRLGPLRRLTLRFEPAFLER